MGSIKEAFDLLIRLISYTETGNELVDTFVWHSSWILEIVAVACIVIMLLRNPSLIRRKTTEDRYMFRECVLVMGMNFLDLSLIPMVMSDSEGLYYLFIASLTINEVLYLCIIIQWLIFVDYSLYRSPDHIRRRYKNALIPLIILTALDIYHSVLSFYGLFHGESLAIQVGIVNYGKRLIELCYIATAIYIVKKHSKESREPRFMRLTAFIIPFVLGLLLRFYDGPLMAVGVILTYRAAKRRNRYIDPSTGFYNREYLSFLGKYRDKKGSLRVRSSLRSTVPWELERGFHLSWIKRNYT